MAESYRTPHTAAAHACMHTFTPFLAHSCDNGVPTTALTVFFELVNSTTTFACNNTGQATAAKARESL